MRATGYGSAGSISALLVCLLASTSTAQDLSPQRVPAVRVYSQNGPGVASNYVTPAIEVSEAAYVFAVMMDVDGRIQVLYPEFPGISVRILSQNQLRLPNFFAGFNEPMQSAPRYSANGFVTYDANGTFGNDARGTVIALASRAPFRLALLEANGDWNISAIRDLMEDRTPEAAARSLAQYFGAKGEPIGSDYMRFAGQHQKRRLASILGVVQMAQHAPADTQHQRPCRSTSSAKASSSPRATKLSSRSRSEKRSARRAANSWQT